MMSRLLVLAIFSILITPSAFSFISFEPIGEPLCNGLGINKACDKADDLDNISTGDLIKVVEDATEYLEDPSKIVKESIKITIEVAGKLRDVVILAGETLADSLERIKQGLEHLSQQAWTEYKKITVTLGELSKDVANVASESLRIEADISTLTSSISGKNGSPLSLGINLGSISDIKLPEIKVDREIIISAAKIVVTAAVLGPYAAIIPQVSSVSASGVVGVGVIAASTYCVLSMTGIGKNEECRKIGQMFTVDQDELEKCGSKPGGKKSKIDCYEELIDSYKVRITAGTLVPIRSHLSSEFKKLNSKIMASGEKL